MGGGDENWAFIPGEPLAQRKSKYDKEQLHDIFNTTGLKLGQIVS